MQICPVGALTGTAYRFQARLFDLVSTPSVCEHCASGCAQRTDHRRGKVLRRLAGDDPEVNEEWNCDKGRWAFAYTTATDRLRHPLVRGKDGELHETSWGQALSAAATGLRSAISGGVGVLTGGRITVEDAYTYPGSREQCCTPTTSTSECGSIPTRRPASWRHTSQGRASRSPTTICRRPRRYCSSGSNRRKNPRSSIAVAPRGAHRGPTRAHRRAIRLPGNHKLRAKLVRTRPGGEPAVLNTADRLVSQPGSIVIVGERLAATLGGLFAAAGLAARTGASLA